MAWLAFGDSFVAAVGDPQGLGWVGRLAAQSRNAQRDLTLYNLGVRGDTSVDIRQRWRAEYAARTALRPQAALLLSFGVNDCCPAADGAGVRVAPQDSLAAAEEILSQAHALAPTLMIGPPPIAEPDIAARTADLDRLYAALAARLNVPYLSCFVTLGQDATWRQQVAAWDGAHPGASGYTAWTEHIAASEQWRAWRNSALACGA
ncbi:GDSL-type esterase/lipase family protein [Magnetofaba australis]|uniref:GDSL-type esterase/lipase family protein n=1 Tax=Magnetofaba australis TaxID=1472297 RepID=UPI000A19F8B2|nr:GDSL-type esterase/lipase family protein [Magnetofaba australis]